MTLERSKNLFYLAVIAIAIVLDCTGGIVGWIAAVIVLSGAGSMFRAVSDGTARHIINDAQSRCPHLDNDARP